MTISNILIEELKIRREKRPQYSLRLFAKYLNMSPAQLSGLISGKRKLSPKQAQNILSVLTLTESMRQIVKAQLLGENSESKNLSVPLKDSVFSKINKWHFFAILSLANLKNNKCESKWIAKRLGLDEFEAKEALNLLVSSQLIEIQKGKMLRTKHPLAIESEKGNPDIRKYHQSILDIAKSRLETVSPENRHYGSVTFAANPQSIKNLKQELNDFRFKMREKYQDSSGSEVFNLSLQLFPFTI